MTSRQRNSGNASFVMRVFRLPVKAFAAVRLLCCRPCTGLS